VDNYENITIPLYVINNTEDNLNSLKDQFIGRAEFDVHIIPFFKNGSKVLFSWEIIRKIIKISIKEKHDVIIICEDNHEFTKDYSKSYLFDNIIAASEQGANILLGGITTFGQIVPLTPNRCWIDSFSEGKFFVIYSTFFSKVLKEPFTLQDTVDDKFSKLTSNKMILYPFISKVKKSFSGSSKTPLKNHKALIPVLMQIYDRYQNSDNYR
jgi:hypothetical protein